MDLTSALRSEVVRPALTWLVPGALAVGPFVLRLQQVVPALGVYLEGHPTAAFILGVMTALAAGLILERLGSAWEAYVIDARIAKRYPNFLDDWHNFLRKAWDHEPVGEHYLRTQTMQLKFQLGMAPALILFPVGLRWLNASTTPVFASNQTMTLITILCLGAVIYFLKEAWNTGVLLATVRFVLLSEVGTPLPAELAAMGDEPTVSRSRLPTEVAAARCLEATTQERRNGEDDRPMRTQV